MIMYIPKSSVMAAPAPPNAAVVISADDLSSLEETLEIVSRSALIGQVRESLADIASGDVEVLSRDAVLASLRN